MDGIHVSSQDNPSPLFTVGGVLLLPLSGRIGNKFGVEVETAADFGPDKDQDFAKRI